MFLERIYTKILETFFYLLYHQFAWAYDSVANIVSLGQWKNWVYCILPYISGNKILELGFGPGYLQMKLVQGRYPQVIGVDSSPYMSRLATRRMLKENRILKLSIAYAQALPFPNEYFQQVVSTFPSEYVTDPKTIAEVKRVLSPYGQWIILPGIWITGKSIPDRFLRALFNITNQTPNTIGKFMPIYQQAGFEVEINLVHSSTWKCEIIRCVKN